MDSEDDVYVPKEPSPNVKKYIMALLFIQTKDLRKFYEGKNMVQNKCFLIDKNWINNLKNKYNYKESVSTFNSFNDWENYNDFKSKIINSFNIEKDDIINLNEEMGNNFQIKKEKLDDGTEYPVDIELVNEQFFKDCNMNLRIPLYTVFIGNKSIFFVEDQRDNILYHCSLFEGPEYDSNFLIKVNSIFIFQESNIFKEQINSIVYEGITNYLNKNKININSNNKQFINVNNNKIGIFINLINSNQTCNQNINNSNLSFTGIHLDSSSYSNMNNSKGNQMSNQYKENNLNGQNIQCQNNIYNQSNNYGKMEVNNNNIINNNNIGNNNNNMINNNINNNNNNIINNNNLINNIRTESNHITNNKEDEEYCLNYHTDKPFIKISFRGLDNVGATCYMNATLQCLANIKPVTDYLLEQNNYITLYNEYSLCQLTLSYIQVLIGLFCNKSDKGSYCPEQFKNKISELNPLFQGVQANDSKDLVIFLLEEINEELVNIHNKKKNINQDQNMPLEKIDISDEKKIF